jgi:riboflavin kinase/FMN adenylyltransferase
VEVHLIDRRCDLYDQTLEVSFLRLIREDRRFDSADELRAQIARDVEQARRAAEPGG